MNWILAAAAPLLVAGVLEASASIPAAILSYHALGATTLYLRRARIRMLLLWQKGVLAWTALAALIIVVFLLAAPTGGPG